MNQGQNTKAAKTEVLSSATQKAEAKFNANTSQDVRRPKCLLALGALQKIHLQSGEVLKRSAMFFATDCHQNSDLSARSQWSWLRAERS
jgi:hypothetical protein